MKSTLLRLKYSLVGLLLLAIALPFVAMAQQNADKPQEVKKEDGKVKVIDKNVTAQNLIYDGIDVSSYQMDIDWSTTASDKNIKFVYVKATEGATYRSRHYEFNIENARKYGIRVGSYHFMSTRVSIQRQFQNFISVVEKDDQDLVPLIDIEEKNNWTAQQVADSVLLFAQLLEQHYGCRPMIYTGSAFYNSYLAGRISGYPLFIARYSKAQPRLAGGAKWTLWQFSESGRIAGIDHYVDLCRFNKGCTLKDILIKNNRRRSTAPVTQPKKKEGGTAPAPSKKVEQAFEKGQQKKDQMKADKDRQKEQEKQAKEREKAEKEAKKKAEKAAKEREEKAKKQREADKKEAQRVAEQQEKLRKLKEKEKLARDKQAQKDKEAADKKAAEDAKKKTAADKKAAEDAKKKAATDKKAAEEKKKQQQEEAAKKKKQQEEEAAKKKSVNEKAKASGKRVNGSSVDNEGTQPVRRKK